MAASEASLDGGMGQGLWLEEGRARVGAIFWRQMSERREHLAASEASLAEKVVGSTTNQLVKQ